MSFMDPFFLLGPPAIGWQLKELDDGVILALGEKPKIAEPETGADKAEDNAREAELKNYLRIPPRWSASTQRKVDNIIVLLYDGDMNWITTNIRLPEEDYMELRLTAARKRTSVNALVRERLGVKVHKASRKEFWKKLEEYGKETAQSNPGVSLSQKLIEMRYEQ